MKAIIIITKRIDGVAGYSAVIFSGDNHMGKGKGKTEQAAFNVAKKLAAQKDLTITTRYNSFTDYHNGIGYNQL